MDESQQFSIVPRFVWQGCRAPDVRTYCALAAYADWETGECWPSQQRLAEDMGVGLETVRRSLARLVEVGAIERTFRRTEEGDPDTNLYRLPFAINRPVDNRQRGPLKNEGRSPQKRGEGPLKNAWQTRTKEQDKPQAAFYPQDHDGACRCRGRGWVEEYAPGAGMVRVECRIEEAG